MEVSIHIPSRATSARVATLLAASSLCLSAAAGPLRAGSLDRQVAEWVILTGGSVRLEGQNERIRETSALPAEDFHLELVDLVGANILPPDLQRLIGLERLRILNLPGPMWNPRSGARIDYSRELRHLAGLRTLEELTFSYTFLVGIKFRDDGIEEIASLAPSLRSALFSPDSNGTGSTAQRGPDGSSSRRSRYVLGRAPRGLRAS